MFDWKGQDMKIHAAALCAIVAISLVCADLPAAAQAGEDLIAGRRVAEQICAECHAIHDYETSSPDIGAPTFKQIANDPGKSAQSVAGWLRSSHPAMQNVMLGPADAANVVAYLLSLRQW